MNRSWKNKCLILIQWNITFICFFVYVVQYEITKLDEYYCCKLQSHISQNYLNNANINCILCDLYWMPNSIALSIQCIHWHHARSWEFVNEKEKKIKKLEVFLINSRLLTSFSKHLLLWLVCLCGKHRDCFVQKS